MIKTRKNLSFSSRTNASFKNQSPDNNEKNINEVKEDTNKSKKKHNAVAVEPSRLVPAQDSQTQELSTNDKPKNKSKDNKKSSKWHNVFAGAAAGAASRLVSAPLDVIKIRRQLDMNSGSGNTGLLPSLQTIVKSEGGVRGLFRGNVAAMYLWISYAVVQFSLYERTSQFITKFNDNDYITGVNTRRGILSKPEDIAQSCLGKIASSSIATAFVSGGTAGVAATLVSYPFDTCRTVFASRGISSLQSTGSILASKSPPKTLVEYTSTMLQQNGVRGLYAGVMPAVVQIIPYMGINFALYELLVNLDKEKKAGNAAMAGFISGAASKILVYPLDTIKKRIQAQAFQTSPNTLLTQSIKYNGMIDCFVTISRDEGVRSLYRGMVPSVLKSMLGTGVAFGVYSFSKNLLEIDDKLDKK